MQRVAFLLGLKPDADVAEYKRRHDEIWPDMSETLRAAGMRNYSIFRHGTLLFAYCEVDDWAATQRYLAANDVNGRWQAYMADIMDSPIDPATGSFYLLDEMFHLSD